MAFFFYSFFSQIVRVECLQRMGVMFCHQNEIGTLREGTALIGDKLSPWNICQHAFLRRRVVRLHKENIKPFTEGKRMGQDRYLLKCLKKSRTTSDRVGASSLRQSSSNLTSHSLGRASIPRRRFTWQVAVCSVISSVKLLFP